MNMPYTRAPHQGGSSAAVQAHAPNAALLIDFDNVTMGMRSDLSKDLRKLLQSDIIKGKVTVQRAYADWRRYPQYIVPLSENSIDLIFAPAYGSSKKNATDIRMAIDGMELVFTRPEIGTYILLTGDSDFSSLVLKLKEYGKYVIGVGIQESSSDILVQNCDEYYSYTNLAGLQKTNETDQKPTDPWALVEKSVKRMADRDDVMRSDRLKQVMIEIDAAFDEGNFGYSKFSKFLTEAASKGLVRLKKLDNGQYEVAPTAGGSGSAGGGRGDGGRGRSRRDDGRGRGRDQDRSERSSRGGEDSRRSQPEARKEESSSGDPLQEAYDLLRASLKALLDDGRDAVRDSDVKRKMLDLQGGFDEAELGFSKFSLFLRQAHDHEVIDLHKRDSGNYEVSLHGQGGGPPSEDDATGPAEEEAPEGASAQDGSPAGGQADPEDRSGTRDRSGGSSRGGGRRLGPRRGSTRRRGGEGPPPLLEGQTVGTAQGAGTQTRVSDGPGPEASRQGPGGDELDPTALGLPTDSDAAIRYLSNSYKGVGVKTAEALVEGFGGELFSVLQSDPDRIHEVVPSGRAEAVLDAWKEDFRRRREGSEGGPPESPAQSADQADRSRGRGRRTRRGRRS